MGKKRGKLYNNSEININNNLLCIFISEVGGGGEEKRKTWKTLLLLFKAVNHNHRQCVCEPFLLPEAATAIVTGKIG